MYSIEDVKEKETLRRLYWDEMLSTTQIADKCNINRVTVGYWLKKHKIAIRPPTQRYRIPKELLKELYINRRKSTGEIANLLEVKSRETIRCHLNKHGIQLRAQIETATKYKKTAFSWQSIEMSYMVGFRVGDLHVMKDSRQIRVSCTTSHPAQIELFHDLFSNYSHIKVYPFVHRNLRKEWIMYCHLDPSFEFLIKKHAEIPKWILERDDEFYAFLAGYADAEGCWYIRRSDKNSVTFLLRLASYDVAILQQIKAKLEELGYSTSFRLSRKAGVYGGYVHRGDLYSLEIQCKNDVVRLANKMLPHIRHGEKTRKVNLILRLGCQPSFDNIDEVEQAISDVTKEIKEEMRLLSERNVYAR